MTQLLQQLWKGKRDCVFQSAIGVLLLAYEHSQLSGRGAWDFAVNIDELRELGLSANDLRLLQCVGLVEHAMEVTVLGDDGRAFRPTGDMTFVGESCFVLRAEAVSRARDFYLRGAEEPLELLDGAPEVGDAAANSVRQHGQSTSDGLPNPEWNKDRRELWVGKKLLKRFKWHAPNQERILNAFQEDDWPQRIDDPLPPAGDVEPRQRLHDTIKCLNRNQSSRLIRFHGDGTGTGITWRFVS